MIFRNAAIAVLSAASALTLPGPADAAPATAAEEQIAPYLTPQKLVNIGEGRTINLVCLGRGSPTVILTAGLGDWSLTWRLVQRQLAERTRVCAWDRAGYGFSSPSSQPQDTTHTTQDLEKALESAKIAGPYVMVGHSLGAYKSLRFTDLHRKDVVGMVLVDPTLPDQQALMQRISPLFFKKARALDGLAVKKLRDCATALRNNTVTSGTPEFEQCTASTVPADFPNLGASLTALNADPARLITQASTISEFDSDAGHDAHEAINARRRYGNMPLVVLTAGRDEATMAFLAGDAAPAEAAEFHRQIAQFLGDAWAPGHEAYAALSTQGRTQIVDSGHGIQREKPDVVISAITEVLDKIKSAPEAASTVTETARNPHQFLLKLTYKNFITGNWSGDADLTISQCPQPECFSLSGPVKLPLSKAAPYVNEGIFLMAGSPCKLRIEEVPKSGMDSGDWRVSFADTDQVEKACASWPAELEGLYSQGD